MSEQNAQAANRPPIETGCPDAFQYMHPVMRRTMGNGHITKILAQGF